MLKHIIRTVTTTPSKLRARRAVSKLPDGDYLIRDVPYCSQFASPKLTKDILEKQLDAVDDPNWSIFGFDTRKEAAY